MRLLVATVLGAIGMFAFGAFWWVGLPFANMTQHALPDEETTGPAIGEMVPDSGVYYYPGDMHDMEKFAELHEAGPIYQIFFSKDGSTPMGPEALGAGFLHMAATALFLSLLVLWVKPKGGFLGRWLFVVVVGFIAVFFRDLNQPIWWPHDWGYWIAIACAGLGSVAVGGLPMALVLRPAKAKPAVGEKTHAH